MYANLLCYIAEIVATLPDSINNNGVICLLRSQYVMDDELFSGTESINFQRKDRYRPSSTVPFLLPELFARKVSNILNRLKSSLTS